MKRLKTNLRKLGFTLMEVNLAIFIMAMGVLAMASLYPLGYRENQQSRDDVWSACEADRIFNQLHATLSERAIEWNTWHQKLKDLESSCGTWENYCDKSSGWSPKKKSAMNNAAKSALTKLESMATTKANSLNIDSKRVYAIVVQPGRIRCHGEIVKDYSRVAISMRIGRSAGTLFSQPIYFTEIHFQGDQKGQ